MGLIKSKREKELEQKMLVRKTITNLEKQISQLEDKKKIALEKAKQAKKGGFEAEYGLAQSMYKISVTQQNRAKEMLLNFELVTQLKDMASLTSEFLKGLSSLSKEMVKLTNNKEFLKVQQQFDQALTGVEQQSEQIDLFMDESEGRFKEQSQSKDAISNDEFDKLIDEQVSQDEIGSDEIDIDAELESLRKKLDTQE